MKSKKVLWSSLCAGILLSAAAENLLPNSGLEEWVPERTPEKNLAKIQDGLVPKGWHVGESRRAGEEPWAETARDQQIRHGGESSLKLVNHNAERYHRLAIWDLPVKSEGYYRVSAWVRGEDVRFDQSKRNRGVVLMFSSGPKANFWGNRHSESTVLPLSGTFDWTEISHVYHVPQPDDQLMLTLSLQQASGTLWIDDLKLEEATEADFVKQEEAERTSKFAPTVSRIHYGPAGRQILSLYQAKTEGPAPVLVYIHGGGWLGGNGVKECEQGAKDGMIERMNRNGITVAAINYRLTPLPDPVYDAARAIQFLRYHAKEYNLDKERFLATGFSAGATTSLWLAVHDDLADPKSEDPVARESTRLLGAFAMGAQTTIDPMQIREWKNEEALKHQMICRSAGFRSNDEMFKNYESKKDLYHEFSAVNHVSKDDPLVLLSNGRPLDYPSDGIHHAIFGYQFKLAADRAGAPCDIFLHEKDRHLVSEPRFRNGDEYMIKTLTGRDPR